MKITKMSINGENKKVFNVKSDDNSEKIQVIDGVVFVTKDKKTSKLRGTLKKTKEILEMCSCYEARKLEEANKKASKKVQVENNVEEVQEVQEIETIEADIVGENEIQENIVEENSTLLIESQENSNNEEKSLVKPLNDVFEEREKNHFLDVLMNGKEEEYSSYSFHISNVEPMVDARCKAHKENINGSLERFTNFTVYVGSDCKELNLQLTKAMVMVMEKNLECYGLLFDMDNIIEYDRDNMKCMECILKIPYQSGISDIRKNVCKSYYDAKKKVLVLYRALKKIKAQQDKQQEKKMS